MVAYYALIGLASMQVKPIVDISVLKDLAAKVTEIGQKGSIDKQVGIFLALKGKDVIWHAKFDTERQVQVYGTSDAARLIFLVPEKAFPEFGKTWIYSVMLDGLRLKAGVSKPREAFTSLSDDKANRTRTRTEIDYWVKELGITVK